MRRANRNVILSHGGKHGVQSRTLLKGQVVSQQAAQHVPAGMIDTAQGGANPGDPTSQQERVAKVVQTSAKKALAQGKPAEVKAAKAVVEPPATRAAGPPPAPPEAPKPPPPPPVEEAAEDPLPSAPAPVEPGVSVPQNKRQLSKMRKAEVYQLALDLGLDVPDDPDDILSTELRHLLAEELGL